MDVGGGVGVTREVCAVAIAGPVCYRHDVQRSVSGFETVYRRHLAVQQRRMVLDALCQSLPPSATVGEIVDAAAMLGWPEVGELSLADLADALLSPDAAASQDDDESAADDDDDDALDEDEDAEEEEDDDEEAEPEPAPVRAKARAVPAPVVAKPVKVAAPKPAKGKSGKALKVSLDERMSPEEAASSLLPLVEQLGEATMQQLEEATAGGGRRKLRFHIGQLVKNGRLARHGMGRGTYYTLA